MSDPNYDIEIAQMLSTMNKGQYLLLCEAIRQLGGELRIDWADFAAAATQPSPRLNVDATDGPIVIRLKDSS